MEIVFINFKFSGVETLFNAEINQLPCLTLDDKDKKHLVYKKRIDPASDNIPHVANEYNFNLAA